MSLRMLNLLVLGEHFWAASMKIGKEAAEELILVLDCYVFPHLQKMMNTLCRTATKERKLHVLTL